MSNSSRRTIMITRGHPLSAFLRSLDQVALTMKSHLSFFLDLFGFVPLGGSSSC